MANAQKEQLQTLIKSRGYLRTRITKVINDVNDRLNDLTENDGLRFTDKLNTLKCDLNEQNQKVFKSMLAIEDETTVDSEVENANSYDDQILDCLFKLNNLIGQSSNQSSQNNYSNSPIQTTRNQLKLPKIPLPAFSNDRSQNFHKFITSFEAIVDKFTISSYEKFCLLKQQLTKSPLALIESLSVNEQSYEIAKQLLTDAFDNKSETKFEVIRRLSLLKLSYNDDPYIYIGETKSILAEVESLKINVQDILQYFVWQGLNHTFQDHLTNITNKSKPDLDEIMTNMFEATNRFKKSCDNNKSNFYRRQMTNDSDFKSRASNVNVDAISIKGTKFCPLCKQDNADKNHDLRDCEVYKNASDKVNKIKSLNGCIKCGYINHPTADCRFNFTNQCRLCGKKHATHLCLSAGARGSAPQTPHCATQQIHTGGKQNPQRSSDVGHNSSAPPHGGSRTSATAHTVMTRRASVGEHSAVEIQHSAGADDVALPTFTADVVSDVDVTNIRCFKDSGAQRNFIKASLATRLNLVTLEQGINLNIKGFVAAQNVKTNIVEVPIKIDNSILKIPAICIDSINTSFSSDNMLEVINLFEKKGYKLADTKLKACTASGIVNDIELILGSESSHILPSREIVFGESDPSAYIETPVGVMLSGNYSKMLSNSDYLPSLVRKNSSDSNLVWTCSVKNNDVDSKLDLDSVLEQCALDSSDNNYQCSNKYELSEETDDGRFSENDVRVVEFVSKNIVRKPDGRIIAPIPWNNKNVHLISKNYKLSIQILKSTLKKLQSNPDLLKLYDGVINEQRDSGIIERVDIDRFTEDHPEHAFLPHMGVFKFNRETTKCRVVFLSNLKEVDTSRPLTVSHNQCILAGPSLNTKISSSISQLRFDDYLLVFDIEKAFLSIELPEGDQSRLLFLWFDNIKNDNFNMVGYKCVRLPFGIPCSPMILMASLHKMLVEDACRGKNVDDLTKMLYANFYVDNGGFTSNSHDYLTWACKTTTEIFAEYKFRLQQFYTNDVVLQSSLDTEAGSVAPQQIKLLGLSWDRLNDTLSPDKIILCETANTKRKILSTINSVYDTFNVHAPMMLRSRIFVQSLQLDKSLGWDTPISPEQQKQWTNISRQANNMPTITINRSVGKRDSKYDLICFTDASKNACGSVIYIKEHDTHKVSFFASHTKLLSEDLRKKSMPSLELLGIRLGLEALMEAYNSISGVDVLVPIQVNELFLYTDSNACLHWIESFAFKFSKLSNISTFQKNNLKKINDSCNVKSVTFRHTAGNVNTADLVTKPYGSKTIIKSRFYQGPEIVHGDLSFCESDLSITLPNPQVLDVEEIPDCLTLSIGAKPPTAHPHEQAADGCADRACSDAIEYPRFSVMIGAYACVIKFIRVLRNKVRVKNNASPEHASVKSDRERASVFLITREQQVFFRQEFGYLNRNGATHKKDIPPLVVRFNLFLDSDCIIRVKSKFKNGHGEYHPILMPKNSGLTISLIRETHHNCGHGGAYGVLKELRLKFYIVNFFTIVRRVIRECVVCRRYNARPIKLNQSSYRERRVNPNTRPFSDIFLDYIGPFHVKLNGVRTKVWLLIFTCMWSRAVNLLICRSADTDDFLRAVQIHIYAYGLFSNCVSDLGSQIKSGANKMAAFLNDVETRHFLEKRNVQFVKFEQYPKGNSALGAIVEVCVKQTKLLIHKSIRNLVLDYFEFEFLITKTIHLINKRPIAFQNKLSSVSVEELPLAISPEMVIKGYETEPLNVIPELAQTTWDSDESEDFTENGMIIKKFSNLCKARERLIDLYHSEFLGTLIKQAVDKSDRYKHVVHERLKVGDIVLLVEKNTKRYLYPMGRVSDVETNDLDEVTAARVFKGDTRETVYRHASSLILLLPIAVAESERQNQRELVKDLNSNSGSSPSPARPSRIAASRCRDQISKLADSGCI